MTHPFQNGLLTLKSGQKLAYTKRAGTGQTYVLLHGFSGNRQGLRALAEALPAEEEVILLDLPGFGGSDDPPDAAHRSLKHYASFLAEALAALPSTQRIVLAGHSFGAGVGFSFLAEQPHQVQHFVAICPVASKRLPARWLGSLSVAAAQRLGFEITKRVLSWPLLVDAETWYLLGKTPKNRYELVRAQRLREAQAFRPSLFTLGALVDAFAAEQSQNQLALPVSLIVAKDDNVAGADDADWFVAHCSRLSKTTLPGNHLLPCVAPELVAKTLQEMLAKRPLRV